MRDPARIPKILAALEAAWLEAPDMRLGQLLINVAGRTDLWHVEDDMMLDHLIEWRETSQSWVAREPSVTATEGGDNSTPDPLAQ